jgi:hypothetical protein
VLDSPVRIDHLKIFSADDAPPVPLRGNECHWRSARPFTVTKSSSIKTVGSRRGKSPRSSCNLDARETKYSAMVLDVGPIAPTDSLMAGVDQAQRVGSDQWWRADLRALAEQAATVKKR